MLISKKNLILVFSLIAGLGFSQTPTAEYNFNDCNIDENTGNYINNVISGAPQCFCGPVDMAFEFDGQNDFIQLDDQLKDILIGDYTLSFLFWLDSTPQKYNLFAIKKIDCIDIDSTMHIAYDPNTNLMEFNITRNIGDRINVFEPVDDSKCWHHLAITKTGTDYSFYLDQKFLSTENFGTNYVMSDSAAVYLGNTECATANEQLMKGRIDELKFFNAALSLSEINQLAIDFDEILTDDMTIFSGESVAVSTSSSCAQNFLWNSTIGFDDPNSLNPVIMPPMTNTYILNFDYGTCMTQDSIRINVLDVEDRDCDGLLLPKAFTPNNDGLNDTYGISNGFLIDELIYFEIYDRWGTKVFETNEPNGSWDGTLNGIPVNATAFVYKVKYMCLDEEQLAVGNFSILR